MMLVEGHIKDHFLVRLNEYDKGVVVRRVIVNEYFEPVNILGNLEIMQDSKALGDD